MSFKRYDGQNYVDTSNQKRFDGTNWIDVSSCKRFDGNNWIETLDLTPKFKVVEERNVAEYNGAMYALLAPNRLKIKIRGMYNANDSNYYVRFACEGIIVPASLYCTSYYTLNGVGTSRDVMIGINSISSATSYGTYTKKTGNYNTDTPVNTSTHNQYGVDCCPSFKVETGSNMISEVIVQIDSIVVNNKTYNPVFEL